MSSPTVIRAKAVRLVCIIAVAVGALGAGYFVRARAKAAAAAQSGIQIVELPPVAVAGKVRTAFVLTNPGQSARRVTKVDRSCGCTQVDVPPVIGPGERVRVPVTIDAPTLEGPSQWDVTVHDDQGGTQRFRAVARVVRPWPERIDLGVVAPESTAPIGSFDVKSVSGKPLGFELRSYDGDFLLVSDGGPPDPSRDAARVKVGIAPTAPAGPFSKVISFYHGEQGKVGSVEVVGTVQGPLLAEPSYLILGSVAAGETMKRTFTLRSRLGGPLELRSIEVLPPDHRHVISARPRRRDAHSYDCEVIFENGVRQEQIVRADLRATCVVGGRQCSVVVGLSAVAKVSAPPAAPPPAPPM